MSRPKVLSAGHWLWCKPATKSKSTLRRGKSIFTSATWSSRAAAPPGHRRRRIFCAATARCIPSILARPTRAAISIFSRARNARRSRRFIDDKTARKHRALRPAGRTAMIHIRLFVAMLALLFAGIMPAGAQSPAFRVDPYWPKPLPNNWILGQVGGMAIDAQDNIWVFQRPRSLTDDEKGATFNPPRSKCCVPAPSVLVFNQAGDVVKSWGGPGDNLGYDWPLQEHAILVDNKGFVWLSGNGK